MGSTASAGIQVQWNSRRKVWDLTIVSARTGDQPYWSWTLSADSQVALDAGTGFLILAAVRDALEHQLI